MTLLLQMALPMVFPGVGLVAVAAGKSVTVGSVMYGVEMAFHVFGVAEALATSKTMVLLRDRWVMFEHVVTDGVSLGQCKMTVLLRTPDLSC